MNQIKKVIVFLITFVAITGNLLAQLKITSALVENKINPLGVSLKQLHFHPRSVSPPTCSKNELSYK